MFNKILNALVDQPILGSIFIADFFMVFFIKSAHWSFSALMVGSLIAMSMYFGQKLTLFKMSSTESVSQAD